MCACLAGLTGRAGAAATAASPSAFLGRKPVVQDGRIKERAEQCMAGESPILTERHFIS